MTARLLLGYRAAIVLSGATVAPAAASSTSVVVTKGVEADSTHTLVHEVVVRAPLTEVWPAISTAEGWQTWAVPIAWMRRDLPDILETSYDPAAKPNDAGTIHHRFTARIPGRLLAFRTVKAPAGFPHWEAYQLVSSVFELEQVGSASTRVRLTSVGYPNNQAGKQLITFFEKGNADSLEWLRQRFVEGPADWKKRLSVRK
jgi:uncharacterized protein YndB with AHSA1/START domain